MTRPLGWLLWGLLGLALPATAGPFGNTSNTPFASRCNGPQGAIVVRDDGVRSSAARDNVRAAAVQSQHAIACLRHPAASLRKLQRAGVLSATGTPRFPRLIVHTRGGKIVRNGAADAAASAASVNSTAVSTAAVGDPANQLTFTYEGWSAAGQATIEAYLATAYPKARLYFGPPAHALTIKIIRDDTIADIQGGTYDTSTHEIRMPEWTGSYAEDSFVLLMLVLRAFHDDAALYYDAWEEGFIGAAATAIQVQPGIASGYDPKDPGTYYSLSVYEAENHPGLGNSTFYGGGSFSGMLAWRIAMARAAWLKCWIEDSLFFARFNEVYYSQFTDDLPGDVPALREIAATVLPQVEGMPFQEWFERQYILDTSIRTGLKEYTWNVPVAYTDTSGDSVHGAILLVEHYMTGADGAETPRSGTATTVYWNYNFSVSLYAEEGNSITISDSGDTPGEGSLSPTFFNVGGAQRITIQVDVGGLRAYYPYPYGVRGFEVGQNNLYGAILNQSTGTLDVVGGDGISGLSVKRGVWGKTITTGSLSPMQLTATFTNPGGQTITRVFNVGWDSYMVLLDGGVQDRISRTYLSANRGLHMISLPVTPLVSSIPQMFGIAETDLLLARWDPTQAPDGTYNVWPDCEPFEPGRGYWLRVLNDVAATITGVKPAEDQRILVPLDLGWNMIGSVRTSAVNAADLKIQIGTEAPVRLADAVSSRLVQQGIFAYEQGQGYVLAETLQPGVGYWIRVLNRTGCRLAFEPLASTSDAAASAAACTTPAWKVPLRVTCGGLSSSSAYLGGASGATAATDPTYDMQAPPAFGDCVTARFVREEDGASQSYLTDVRGVSGVGESWDVQVASTVAGSPLRLEWPDLSQLPAQVRPFLVDESTGRRVAMRTTTAYVIPAADEPISRRLRVELRPASAGALALSGVSGMHGTGVVTVSYRLSGDASVDARVLNIAGRPVRSLASGKLDTAGANVVTWNLRDDGGHPVPRGTYLLELQASDELGQRVRSVAPVQVSR